MLIRTDGSFGGKVELVDSMATFRVAFTFVQMPTSGIVAVFVASDFLQSISKRGFLEQIYGLDDAKTQTLLSDAINKDGLDVVLAGDSGYKYDMKIPFDDSCKQVLAKEWNAILSHHRKIRGPDFEAAGRRLFELFPAGTNPILPA